MSKEAMRRVAIRILEGLSLSEETDIEMIATMPIVDVEEGLRQMGVNPTQPLPLSIRQLIFESRGEEEFSALDEEWKYERLIKPVVAQKGKTQPGQHEGQIARQPAVIAGAAHRTEGQGNRNREFRAGSFADADALFRKGLDAYRGGYLEQAIEYWREAKVIFLNTNLRREIAACDRNIGIAFQQLGESRLAIQQLERARSLYLDIGRKDHVESCDSRIGAAYRKLSGHSWR